jgi:hypothetical protein
VAPWRNREVSFVQFHAFFDQFPADAGNDLFAPGIEQSGKCHATRRHRAAELAVSLHQQDARAGAPGLNGCDGSRSAAADDEHINLPVTSGSAALGTLAAFTSVVEAMPGSRPAVRPKAAVWRTN